jgi:hypothetical protein
MTLNKLGTINSTKARQPKVSKLSTNAFADTKILRKLFVSEVSFTCLLVTTIKLNRTLRTSFLGRAVLFYHIILWGIAIDRKVSQKKH